MLHINKEVKGYDYEAYRSEEKERRKTNEIKIAIQKTTTKNKNEKQESRGNNNMKNSNYQNYEDLPLFLNAELLAKVLGVAVSSAYELMHEKGFPSVRIGKRFIVPRDDLKRWMEEQVAKRGSR